ncbi:hypothetical protein BGW36DRAFT_398820 [Talaromyces proteolyticus]|uniref:Uncharacterized protein n=1 Tax=Talaromyces proteolyticus TaxID=1131652 RepID=A0AAD4KNJ8_9EURO|nr:uncharacterized protein BGW36DRAFT_398820 [Talaromyces proteolyticus]KAH8695656.1 hypothetical protein BGW36DRAFT_398820 [Talaromyces proteolyticus]
MATPSHVTIDNLNGKWTIDKKLSSNLDPVLALQGVSWVLRKAINASTAILDVKEHRETDAAAGQTTVRIDVVQYTTSGLPGINESRILDWSSSSQENHILGKSDVRARFIQGKRNSEGNILPDLDLQIPVEHEMVKKFLIGEVLEDGTPCEGFLVENPQEEGIWVQLYACSHKAGWTAEQVWGFEMINQERRYTRRLVVANRDGKFQLARLVYNFIKSNGE